MTPSRIVRAATLLPPMMIGDLIHVAGELVEVVAESRMTLPYVETIAERRARMEVGGKPAPTEFSYGILRVRSINSK